MLLLSCSCFKDTRGGSQCWRTATSPRACRRGKFSFINNGTFRAMLKRCDHLLGQLLQRLRMPNSNVYYESLLYCNSKLTVAKLTQELTVEYTLCDRCAKGSSTEEANHIEVSIDHNYDLTAYRSLRISRERQLRMHLYAHTAADIGLTATR